MLIDHHLQLPDEIGKRYFLECTAQLEVSLGDLYQEGARCCPGTMMRNMEATSMYEYRSNTADKRYRDQLEVN